MGEFILYVKAGVDVFPPHTARIIDGGAGFEFYEIDPDDFEWNGRRVRMVVEK